ncbi:hypothetical protein CMUS01_12945 [Colletotrichum musicola]|uniref:Uncharacterized protein n=1 Tax=Colletotrichum musicola TaxID=2175873 RepID=A0A8H6MYH8_9PEZI|nr:hypothetical protein CMUS01_12945 [Colletotrichum musicola]
MEPLTNPADEAIMRRLLETVTKLRGLRQQPGQGFDEFISAYDALEAELPVRLLELYRVCDVLVRLAPQVQWQIVALEIPATRQDLDVAARRAQELVGEMEFMKGLVE